MHPNNDNDEDIAYFDSIYSSKEFLEATMESFIRQVQEKYDELNNSDDLEGLDTLLNNLYSGDGTPMFQNYSATGSKFVVELVTQYAPKYLRNLIDDNCPFTDEERSAVSDILINNTSREEKMRLRAFIEKPKLQNLHEIIPLRQDVDASTFMSRYEQGSSNVALWTGIVLGLYMNGDISSNEGTSLLLQLKAHGGEGQYFDEACKYILRSERMKGDNK